MPPRCQTVPLPCTSSSRHVRHRDSVALRRQDSVAPRRRDLTSLTRKMHTTLRWLYLPATSPRTMSPRTMSPRGRVTPKAPPSFDPGGLDLGFHPEQHEWVDDSYGGENIYSPPIDLVAPCSDYSFSVLKYKMFWPFSDTYIPFFWRIQISLLISHISYIFQHERYNEPRSII
jgi:hypothetical protein